MMNSFLIVKYQLFKESSQLLLVQSPQVLTCYLEVLIKTIFPIQCLLMLLNLMLVKFVFHCYSYFFPKRNYYCFVSLDLFIKWKFDLLEKIVVGTAEILS